MLTEERILEGNFAITFDGFFCTINGCSWDSTDANEAWHHLNDAHEVTVLGPNYETHHCHLCDSPPESTAS